jgi:peptide/nickel transport system substrate-binding protein
MGPQRWRRPMSRRSALGTLGAGAGITSLALAGCTGNAAAPAVPAASPAAAPPAAAAGAPAAAGAAPRYGGKLTTVIDYGEPHLDPHLAPGASNATSPAICYSQLITLKWGPDVKLPSWIAGPDLAESWEQADELTFIFKLRQGARWHNMPPVNGRELVADDIVYAYDRVREQKSYASSLAGIIRSETPDRYTLKFTLDKPNADFLGNLTARQLKVVAREAVAASGDLKGPPVIGSGPWLFESWSQGDQGSFAVRRNPDYYRKGLPHADGVEVARTDDFAGAGVSAFRAGAINIIAGVPRELVAGLEKALPDAAYFTIPLDRAPDNMILNATAPPLDDPRVRQAISKAIDRQAIIATIPLGQAKLFSPLALPAPDWALPEAEINGLLARDVAGARRLLREAGLEAGFDVAVSVPTYVANSFVNMAELIQQHLKEVGIRLAVKPVDPGTSGQIVANGNYQIWLGGVGLTGTNGDLYARYHTGGTRNNFGYDNPALNRLIDQQAVLARDPDARKRILQDIQRQVLADAIILYIETKFSPVMTAREVRDMYVPVEFNSSHDFWQTTWVDK